MKIIKAESMGIIAGNEVGKELSKLFAGLRGNTEPTKVVFSPGIYNIDANNCDKEDLYITNTMGVNQWRSSETPYNYPVAINIHNVQNLTIEADGAMFMIDGKATNIVLQDCQNITVNNLTIEHSNPNCHSLKITRKTAFSIEFEINKTSQYVKENGDYFFIGNGFKFPLKCINALEGHIPKVDAIDTENLKRSKHPLMGAVAIKEIKPYTFKAYFLSTIGLQAGNEFFLYDVRRTNVGAFVHRSSNITFNSFKQHFNYSLAFVAQDCENVSVDKAYFAPREDSDLQFASVADFFQISMCRGDINVTNGTFRSSGDDVLNIHGVHYEIAKIEGNKLTVRFKHHQSLGYNALHDGDKIEYIDKYSLLTLGTAIIKSSNMLDKFNMELEVDNLDGASVGAVIEDIDRCANLNFSGNTMSRIVTRGILVTTRGKVVVDNNNFANTTMHSILLSNDAKSWYESGRVIDARITNNKFGVCYGKNILIKPENSVHNGAVHSNIVIENNDFASPVKGGISIKSTDNVRIVNNLSNKPIQKMLKTKNATNLVIENNRTID